jgi:hypothetical protein
MYKGKQVAYKHPQTLHAPSVGTLAQTAAGDGAAPEEWGSRGDPARVLAAAESRRAAGPGSGPQARTVGLARPARRRLARPPTQARTATPARSFPHALIWISLDSYVCRGGSDGGVRDTLLKVPAASHLCNGDRRLHIN